MAGRLLVKKETVDGQDLYRLSGNIVTGAYDTLIAATAGAKPNCIFNWSAITITSSDGIREWIKFIDDFAKGRKVAMAACPPSVVLCFNLFPRCVSATVITSAYATFVCPICANERLDLLQIGTDVGDDGALKQQPTCAICGQEMELALPEAEYFAFVSSDLNHQNRGEA